MWWDNHNNLSEPSCVIQISLYNHAPRWSNKNAKLWNSTKQTFSSQKTMRKLHDQPGYRGFY